MKSSRKFAKNYLYNVLGNRKGLNIRDLQDEELEGEIVEELANLVEEFVEEINYVFVKDYEQ